MNSKTPIEPAIISQEAHLQDAEFKKCAFSQSGLASENWPPKTINPKKLSDEPTTKHE